MAAESGSYRERSDEGYNRPRRMMGRGRKVCRFCSHKEIKIDYKDGRLLSQFVTDRGKIIPSRISGNCNSHQRHLAMAVKRARIVALLPFTTAKT
jgi:small subunit ribosomal protein S18